MDFWRCLVAWFLSVYYHEGAVLSIHQHYMRMSFPSTFPALWYASSICREMRKSILPSFNFSFWASWFFSWTLWMSFLNFTADFWVACAAICPGVGGGGQLLLPSPLPASSVTFLGMLRYTTIYSDFHLLKQALSSVGFMPLKNMLPLFSWSLSSRDNSLILLYPLIIGEKQAGRWAIQGGSSSVRKAHISSASVSWVHWVRFDPSDYQSVPQFESVGLSHLGVRWGGLVDAYLGCFMLRKATFHGALERISVAPLFPGMVLHCLACMFYVRNLSWRSQKHWHARGVNIKSDRKGLCIHFPLCFPLEFERCRQRLP